MLCDMEQVTALRFILRQPSPAWLHFGIEELQLFPPGSKVTPGSPEHGERPGVLEGKGGRGARGPRRAAPWALQSDARSACSDMEDWRGPNCGARVEGGIEAPV